MIVLLPFQRRWIADHAEVKVGEKSRRVGLTWTEAADAAFSAAAASRHGHLVHRLQQGHGAGVRGDGGGVGAAVQQAARAIEEIAVDDEPRDILAYRVRFASGHKSSRSPRGPRTCAAKTAVP